MNKLLLLYAIGWLLGFIVGFNVAVSIMMGCYLVWG
jgi:hypothetical protein